MVFIPRNFKSWRGGGTGSIERQIVTLTNDQIKALPTTPIVSVSAPDAGSRVAIVSATLRLNSASGAYANVNTTYSTLTFATSLGAWLGTTVLNDSTLTEAGLTYFLAGGANRLVQLIPGHDAVAMAATSGRQWIAPFPAYAVDILDGEAVYLSLDNNGSGNLTGGHANNSLKITTYYAIEEL